MSRQALKNVIRLLEENNRQLPVEQTFLNDLKRTIELEDKKHRRKPSQSYKPSSMNCIRNMYYQVTGAEEEGEDANYCLVGIVNSGSDIHVRIQSYIESMKNNDMDCEYIDVADFVKQRDLQDIQVVSKQGMETKLYHKKLNMSFLTDGIIRYRGRYYILEIKTETSFKWQNRKEVSTDHYHQATAYSIAFGLDNVIFLYINRDVLDMKAFLFTVTGEMKQGLIGMIDTCDSYIVKKQVPPMPEQASSKFCQYCGYRNKCKGDG